LSLFIASEKFRVEAIEAFKKSPIRFDKVSSLKTGDFPKLIPPMVTLGINGGRKDKMRPGDILGALTGNTSLQGNQIGKIDIFDKYAYVAVEQSVAKQVLSILSEGKIKGRKFKIRKL